MVFFGNIYNGETVRLIYRSRGRATGLTDVKLVELFNPSGTQIVTNGVATEQGSSGSYYYDQVTDEVGDWHGYMDSTSTPYPQIVNFRCIAPLRQGIGGGGFIYPTITPDEKEKLFELLREIKKNFTKTKKDFSVEQSNFQNHILTAFKQLESENSNLIKAIKNLNTKIDEDYKMNELRDKILLEIASAESLAKIIDKDEKV